MKRGSRRACDAWGRMGGAYGEVVSDPEDSALGDSVSVRQSAALRMARAALLGLLANRPEP